MHPRRETAEAVATSPPGEPFALFFEAQDWAATPVGPIETWPASLRTLAGVMLGSSQPMFVAWGEDRTLLYNEAYTAILAGKHPRALGRDLLEVWAEVRDDLAPIVERAYAGEPVHMAHIELVMLRHGFPEEAHFAFSYTPVRDADGAVEGFFCACVETTAQVLAERRRAFLTELDRRLRDLSDPLEIAATAQAALGAQLKASRVGYGEVDESERYFTTADNWTDGTVPPRHGTHDLAGFGPEIWTALRRGEKLVVRDVRADPRTSAPDAVAAFEAIDTAAVVTATLVKDGRMRAALYVHHREPQRWSDDDATLVEEVAERTWAAVERARAEAKLRESEARFRNMADHAPVMMWVTDATGYCTYLSRGWYEFTGQTPAEAEGFGWLDATHPDDKAEAERVFTEANAARAPIRLEYRLRRADGSYRWAIDAAAPRFGPDGAFLGYVGSVIDIDERREAEERLRAFADAVPAFVWFATPDGSLHYFNRRWYEYTGQTEAEALPDGWTSTLHPDDAARTAELWADARARGVTYEIEVRYRRRDGSYRWYVARAEPVRDAAGGIVRWFGTSVDIHDRRLAEEELRRLNETLESRVAEALAERKLWADVFESTDALIGAVGPDHCFLALNKAYADEFERIFGVRPSRGDCLGDLLAHLPEHRAAAVAIWDRALAGEEFVVTEAFGDTDRVRPYYELRFNPLLDKDGRTVGAFQYAVDVTERLRNEARLVQAQEALRQAQKMESIGQLTGGIAHDFNNLLTGIIGSLDLLERRVSIGRTENLERYTTTALASARRAAALTQRLLAFSRRQALDPKPTDLNALVRSMEDLIRRSVGERVAVEAVVAGGLWATKIDRNQLESALLNLCVNARDAMPDGGRITVETSNGHLDAAYAARHADVKPGQYVVLSVTDTGTGMSPDVIARAFEPFFTTKPIGKGTGLGLSQLHGFVKQSGGHVAIYSEPGHGTTVRIYLPRHHGAAETERDHALPELARTEANETVLVVEDEDTVRMLVVDVLDELGYAALEAVDADGALAILESGAPIDLLVTDVGLPGMNGRQLADRARELRPDLKVLFITGYAHNAAVGNGLLEPGMAVVTKPFAVDHLAARIAEMVAPVDPRRGG